MKRSLKLVVRAIFLMLLFPLALLAAFGRFRLGFNFGAQACALAPGLPGEYIRAAYCYMTLRQCAMEVTIGFGSYFSRPDAAIESRVHIGAFTTLGKVHLREGCLIGSGVHVISGSRQHARDSEGRLIDTGIYEQVEIGRNCWIGPTCVIMADIAPGCTIAGGSVISKPIRRENAAVAGNPARIVEGLLAARES